MLRHRDALLQHLRERWQDLFGAQFDVLLYDLTSTYFESDPPFSQGDKRRFGYSRDRRFPQHPPSAQFTVSTKLVLVLFGPSFTVTVIVVVPV